MTTQSETILRSAPRRRPAAMLSGLLHLAALHRSRRGLAAVSEQTLDDIGISRAEAEREAARPIWDAPQSWYR